MKLSPKTRAAASVFLSLFLNAYFAPDAQAHDAHLVHAAGHAPAGVTAHLALAG